MEKLTGFSSAELVGKKAPYPWWTEETTRKNCMALEEAMRKGATKLEAIFQRKNGERFRVEITSTPVRSNDEFRYYLSNWVDITERKRAEEALKESKERYETLFKSAGEGILIADIETKKVEYANPAICKMLGYSVEELKRMGVSDIHPKDELKHAISEFEALARGEKTLSSDIPCLRKDGTIIYADIDSTKALIDGRECNLGFFRDATERKRAVEESKHLTLSLREHVKELEESQKKIAEAYRLREHFLKETSHRIITPVAIIGGNSELLLESSNLDEDQKERIRIIREKNEEIQKLVKDALAGKYLKEEEEGDE